MTRIIWLIAIFSNYLQALQYSYPVANVRDDSIYYVYQKTLSDLELWQYQIPTGIVNKQLYWRFMPIELRMLPDNSGFSFIDTDRLRIKKFMKRSPSTIEFNFPVYGIGQVRWMNKHLCYFSAKQKDHYAIFGGDLDTDDLVLLHQSPQAECSCPQMMRSGLFCIERNTLDRSCAIVQLITFGPADNLTTFKPDQFIEKKLIIDCGYQQVVYFELLSDTLGFYIESMPYINQGSLMISFICHQITYSAQVGQWVARSIFKFSIPKKYLMGDVRLYESYIPFLPRAQKTLLYFADIKQNESGQYYSSIEQYDLISGQKICILTSDPNRIIFAPIWSNNLLFCGQILEMSENHPVESDGPIELVKINLG